MLTFSVDCGEVLGGRVLRLTGLRTDGRSDDVVHADHSEHRPGKPVHLMVALTYELRPGLTHDAPVDGRDVDASIRLRPPADPRHWPAVLREGEEREVAAGGPVTRGAFGPFVLPDATAEIRVELTEISKTVGGVGPVDSAPERRLGELVIDLASASATWHPAP